VRRAALLALAFAFTASQPAQAEETASSCAPKDLAALKSWEGVWGAEGLDGDIAGSVRAQPKFLGANAPWNDEGWNRMRKLGIFNRAHPLRIAAAWGFPTMMNSYSEVKFIIAPDETVMTSQYRDIRYIYTDGRGHPSEDELWPNNWGDSIGCWKGDTLEIDTIGAKFDPAFNYMAAPLSEQAHFVERLRAVAPDRIEGEMTITDPVTLTGPWTVKFAFVPAGIDRLIHEGDTLLDREEVQGDKVVFSAPTGEWYEDIALPPEAPLSTAQLDRVVGHYAFEGQPSQLNIERRGDRLYMQITPFRPNFIPIYAEGPLSFVPVDGGAIRFTTDAAGGVTGFEGTNAFGQAMKGTRAAS
jgi:hypothetical protein